MSVIPAADARRTSTPNATMTTYASPSQGRSTQALWRVEMVPGAAGPRHTMNCEQIWTTQDGAAQVTVGESRHDLTPGDTVVIPAGAVRQVIADPVHGFTAIVTGTGGALATADDRDAVVPPWMA